MSFDKFSGAESKRKKSVVCTLVFFRSDLGLPSSDLWPFIHSFIRTSVITFDFAEVFKQHVRMSVFDNEL